MFFDVQGREIHQLSEFPSLLSTYTVELLKAHLFIAAVPVMSSSSSTHLAAVRVFPFYSVSPFDADCHQEIYVLILYILTYKTRWPSHSTLWLGGKRRKRGNERKLHAFRLFRWRSCLIQNQPAFPTFSRRAVAERDRIKTNNNSSSWSELRKFEEQAEMPSN